MFVLSGKKIINVVLGIFSIMLVFTICISISNEKDDYVDTVGVPVSGKTVIIDAGHGVPDEGDFELKL